MENQLGRRNLTKAKLIELAARKVELIGPTRHVSKTKATAKEAGVPEQTVYRFVTIKKLADPELIAQVQCGEISINAAYRGLDVNTKIVTVMYDSSHDQDEHTPQHVQALHENIRAIGNLYDFLLEILFEGDVKDIRFIYRRLLHQIKQNQ